MNKIFITSSFAGVYKHFPDFVKEDCSGKTVTFIPTASIPEKVKSYVGADKKAFKKLGIIVDELELSTASNEEINSKLNNNDYIFISGGNTFYLLQELKRTGADQLIKKLIDLEKVYIGTSAGSIVLSPDIRYVKSMDDSSKAEKLDDYKALGIIDFYPLPHHTNFPFKKTVENIISEYKADLDLRPMTNKQAITVWGDKIEFIV